MSKPDFVGIGMERAGTSWIFTQLASHPDVWVPPIKELHYFDSVDPLGIEPPKRYRNHLLARLRQKAAPLMRSRLGARPQLFKNTYLEYLAWDRRYFLGAQDHDWYRSLFDDRFTRGRVCGEITPAYSTLSPASVDDIERAFPTTRFILSVRDPVARTRSGLLHYFQRQKKRRIEDVPERELLAWLEGDIARSRSSVAEIVRLWRRFEASGRLMTIDFDDIRRRPLELVRGLYQFVGCDPSYQPPDLATKVNATVFTPPSLPPSVEDRIRSLHA